MKACKKATTSAESFVFVLLVVTLIWTGGYTPARAEIFSEGPLRVEVSLTSSTFLLGEPIIIRDNITSPTQEYVVLHTGTRDSSRDGRGADIIRAYHRDWLTLSLKDDAGQSAAVQPDLHSPPQRDTDYTATRELSRHNAYALNDEYRLVNKWLVPTHPGNYVLTVSVQLPYAVLSEGAVGPDTADTSALAAGTVFRHDYQFPIVIQKSDAVALKSKAETLRKSVVQETDVARQRMLIESLFALPEAQATASWQALVNDPSLTTVGKESVANELAQLRSVGAADILAGMFPTTQEAANPNITVSFGSHYLEEMYQGGDASLQQYISQLYAEHGIAFPRKPIPQIVPQGYVAVGQSAAQ